MVKKQYYNAPPTNGPVKAPRDAVLAEFGRQVQRLMIDKGWNQSRLAEAAERHMPHGKRFGRDSVSMYIRGLHLPGPTHLRALAAALEVETTDLLPSKGVPSVGTRLPAFEMKDVGEGMAWLRINQAVPFNTALKIAQLLREDEAR